MIQSVLRMSKVVYLSALVAAFGSPILMSTSCYKSASHEPDGDSGLDDDDDDNGNDDDDDDNNDSDVDSDSDCYQEAYRIYDSSDVWRKSRPYRTTSSSTLLSPALLFPLQTRYSYAFCATSLSFCRSCAL